MEEQIISSEILWHSFEGIIIWQHEYNQYIFSELLQL